MGREEPWGREEVRSILVKLHSKWGLGRHTAIGTRVLTDFKSDIWT